MLMGAGLEIELRVVEFYAINKSNGIIIKGLFKGTATAGFGGVILLPQVAPV